jgi:heat shock protein HtpX
LEDILPRYTPALSHTLQTLGLISAFYLLVFVFILAVTSGFFLAFIYLMSVHYFIGLAVCLFMLVFLSFMFPSLIDAITPRRFEHDQNGFVVDINEHPKLREVIRNCAKEMKTRIPDIYYFEFNVNIGITEKGGFWGIGAKRCLIIGIPLICSLNVSEFKTALAHEFAHFNSRTSWLTQKIFKTRVHFQETIDSLRENSGILHWAFLWYSSMYLKTTRNILRDQEYWADYLSSRYSGTGTAMRTLKKIEDCSLKFNIYWTGEVTPILNHNCCPPLVEGFNTYLNSTVSQKNVEKYLEVFPLEPDLKEEDHHPDMGSRIAALSDYDFPDTGNDNRKAIGLIGITGDLDLKLIRTMPNLTENMIANFKSVTWEQVEAIWPRIIKERIEEKKEIFREITPAMFPEKLHRPDELLIRLAGSDQRIPPTREPQSFYAGRILARAMVYLLLQSGWQAHYVLGKETMLTNERKQIYPYEILDRLSTQRMSVPEWQEFCREHDIANKKIYAP